VVGVQKTRYTVGVTSCSTKDSSFKLVKAVNTDAVSTLLHGSQLMIATENLIVHRQGQRSDIGSKVLFRN